MRLVYISFIIGIFFISVFFSLFLQSEKAQKLALKEATNKIQTYKKIHNNASPTDVKTFSAKMYDVVGTIEIPTLNKTLPIIQGADETALEKGIGHLNQTVFPGQKEQIILSGHRDQAFRGFNKIKIDDLFIVHMPYGTFKYKIRYTKIVSKDDTTIIRKIGEEVLVVSTCYPFHYIGNAPKRFVAYAFPVE